MSHIWIDGEYTADSRAAAAAVNLPQLLPPVDAHRHHRGPYTAAGELLRALVPEILDSWPELVHEHDIEVLAATPELRELMPASRETLTSLAVPEERTRFYSRLRTLRIAHGLAEILQEYLRRVSGPRRMLIVENVHHADHTDAELLAVLLRRLDPALLTLVVCACSDSTDEELIVVLHEYAEPRRAEPHDRPSVAGHPVAELAAAYVASDCTSDEPALVTAYHRLDAAERAKLHDARGDLLVTRNEWPLHLGAVPYHREHGSHPAAAWTRGSTAPGCS